MRQILTIVISLALSLSVCAQEFQRVPRAWKWLDSKTVVFSMDGSFADKGAFAFNPVSHKRTEGVTAPEKYSDFPLNPDKAVNLTYSPDSTRLAFTRDNDLYYVDIASGVETRLTFDGTDLILNGYASWVYYEEIFGRPSRYRAFWWSPDSKKIAYYRFDNTKVPVFPIYSPFGQDGSLNRTRYPKAGETNPEVRIGMIDLSSPEKTVWADFDSSEDQYFGTPFWGPDSKGFFVSRMPRIQNTLDVYCVNSEDGSKTSIYHEYYPTWIDWIDNVEFTDKGLYMARRFETGWEQLYFLSYDGKTFRRLTDGPNWSIGIVRIDEKKGDIYFTAKRDATVRQALYKVDANGVVSTLTDPEYGISAVRFSPDGKWFAASYSNARTPSKVAVFNTAKAASDASARLGYVVGDSAGPDFEASKYSLPQLVHITTPDGFELPGLISLPKSLIDAASSKGVSLEELLAGADTGLGRYPVHVEVYGGPDTPNVRDAWRGIYPGSQWFSDNGIINISVDPRSAGHNGRAGEDQAYRQLTVMEVQDYICWAKWLRSLPYVNPDKIGVEGFSFGGTTTVMLLSQANEYFRYGIAGGGVYDWSLYDSHYTERYMDTPQNNPDGYAKGCALNFIKDYPVTYENYDGSVMLALTHGTGDDNVHFQNTLQMVDALEKAGKKFDLRIYPDGMHGYRGYQHIHDNAAAHEFWSKYLLDK